MLMPKPSDLDKDRFRDLMPATPQVEVKPMFKNLSLRQREHVRRPVRVRGGREAVRVRPCRARGGRGGQTFGPPERPMGGYLSLPDAWADHPELAAPWVERAFAHVSTLPPKAKNAPKKR